MKRIIIISLILLVSLLFLAPMGNVEAASRVGGYMKRNGTYVQPHFKTPSNTSKFDNYSTKGNVNPFTGKKGSVNPYKISPKRYR